MLPVHIRRPMQGDHKVVVRLKLERFPTSWWAQARELLEQRIDHRVADEEDAIVRDTGAAKIVVGGFAGSEKPVRDGIGHDPVYFLWHGPIAGADAAFYMRYRHPQLAGDDGTGHGRGHVPDDQAEVALLFQ